MIGLLTLNPIMYNYGGFLQELALQDIIKEIGFDVEIIYYKPSEEMNTFSIKRNIRYLTMDKIKQKLRRVRNTNKINDDVKKNIKLRHVAIDEYRKQELKLSQPISYNKLRNGKLIYDTYVCGSDQIWNPDYNIPSFFLDFIEDKKRKIIYGASFGKTTLKKYEEKRYGEFIKELQYVSVREETAQKLVLKISGLEPELVLDPTLLHSYQYWKKKADTSKKKYTNYIFCYFLDLTKEKIVESQRYAKKNNCKIVMIPYLHDREDEVFGDIQDADVAPNDFLKLIENSTVVLTDSFHATVFSLIFNKDFWVFGRTSGSYNMNTRIDNVLQLYNATERLIEPHELADKKKSDGIYNPEFMEKAKEDSINFLKQVLQK